MRTREELLALNSDPDGDVMELQTEILLDIRDAVTRPQQPNGGATWRMGADGEWDRAGPVVGPERVASLERERTDLRAELGMIEGVLSKVGKERDVAREAARHAAQLACKWDTARQALERQVEQLKEQVRINLETIREMSDVSEEIAADRDATKALLQCAERTIGDLKEDLHFAREAGLKRECSNVELNERRWQAEKERDRALERLAEAEGRALAKPEAVKSPDLSYLTAGQLAEFRVAGWEPRSRGEAWCPGDRGWWVTAGSDVASLFENGPWHPTDGDLHKLSTQIAGAQDENQVLAWLCRKEPE